MHRLFNVIAATGLLILPQATPAYAETVSTSNQAHIVDMSLGDVISWFEQANGLIVRVGDVSTNTPVRATQVNFNRPEFLIWLQQRYDVEYYQHGKMIYLSSGEESTYRVVYLDHLTVDDVNKLLNGYGLHSSSPISGQDARDSDDAEIAILAGPESYLEIAEGLIAKAESERATPPASVSVMRAGVRVGEEAVNRGVSTTTTEKSETGIEE